VFFTKSDYLRFKQCPKSFWLHKQNISVDKSPSSDNILDKGNDVTTVARELFPGGVLVSYDDVLKMVDKTEKLINSGYKTLYEAAFLHENAVVVCDILHYDGSHWNIYEAKSSTSVKERHLDDLAFQQYVVNENLENVSCFIVHINSDYIRGGTLDVRGLFHFCHMDDEVLKRLPAILPELNQMKKILANKIPSQSIGIQCNKYGREDFPCFAKSHCWSAIPDYSVFNLSRIGKKAFDMMENGMIVLDDIPDDFKLSESQKFQVESYKKNIHIFDKEKVHDFLDGFQYPLYFIDFETFQQHIPLFKGIKPYEQIPFQYSLHIKRTENSSPEHLEFLAMEGSDPRRDFAESLCEDIPMGAISIAYNMSFEKMVIRNLAETFHDLREHLMDIHDGMMDLMVPFQKKWVYNNEMKGKYSIKYVLPALFPGNEHLDYKKLNIQNGTMAMEAFENLHRLHPSEVEQVRSDLLQYCKLDTLAMVKIWDYLNEA